MCMLTQTALHAQPHMRHTCLYTESCMCVHVIYTCARSSAMHPSVTTQNNVCTAHVQTTHHPCTHTVVRVQTHCMHTHCAYITYTCSHTYMHTHMQSLGSQTFRQVASLSSRPEPRLQGCMEGLDSRLAGILGWLLCRHLLQAPSAHQHAWVKGYCWHAQQR